MANREFLMLARTYDFEQDVTGWMMSIKYDGQRCLWDGGVTRGKPKIGVPWANNDKDSRYKKEVICTGLWSRYGNVIHAPSSWLDQLPPGVLLDGELWVDRGQFQATRSIISKIEPDESSWKNVKYLVFDLPIPHVLFEDGRINNPQFKRVINTNECSLFFRENKVKFSRGVEWYKKVYERIITLSNDIIQPVQQLPVQGKESILNMLDTETSLGGEGLILRNPAHCWYPKRVDHLLKVKKLMTSEARVIGYLWGEGKYEGMMGSVTVRMDGGTTFQLSGFTDAQRLVYPDKEDDLTPGKPIIGEVPFLPLKTRLEFRHAGWTNDGKPREARFYRKI